jgi:hypothetical protein
MADLRTLEVEVDVNEAYIAQVATTRPRVSPRRLSRHVVRGPRAPGGADRRPPEGDGAGQGLDPRSRSAHPARDGRQVVFVREPGEAGGAARRACTVPTRR